MILGAKAPGYDTWDCSMLRVAGIELLTLISDPGGSRQMDILACLLGSLLAGINKIIAF